MMKGPNYPTWKRALIKSVRVNTLSKLTFSDAIGFLGCQQTYSGQVEIYGMKSSL